MQPAPRITRLLLSLRRCPLRSPPSVTPISRLVGTLNLNLQRAPRHRRQPALTQQQPPLGHRRCARCRPRLRIPSHLHRPRRHQHVVPIRLIPLLRHRRPPRRLPEVDDRRMPITVSRQLRHCRILHDLQYASRRVRTVTTPQRRRLRCRRHHATTNPVASQPISVITAPFTVNPLNGFSKQFERSGAKFQGCGQAEIHRTARRGDGAGEGWLASPYLLKWRVSCGNAAAAVGVARWRGWQTRQQTRAGRTVLLFVAWPRGSGISARLRRPVACRAGR